MKKRRIKTQRIIFILVIILVLEMIPLISKAKMRILYTDNWGLGYGEKGQQPTGNSSKDYLKKYDAFYVGDPSKKVIYLTFDAGYENGNTERILDILKKNEIHAAFFLVGHYVKTNSELVKRMAEEGHLVCNHTSTHPDMTALSNEESFKKEIIDLEDLYREMTGKEIAKYYRPPAGKYNEDNLQKARDLGYKTIFWSLAYVDWKNDTQPTKEHAFSKLLPRIHPGAIVLLHSNSKTNTEILDELINTWKKEGYTFQTLDALK